jgi:predicted transcriptional regulator
MKKKETETNVAQLNEYRKKQELENATAQTFLQISRRVIEQYNKKSQEQEDNEFIEVPLEEVDLYSLNPDLLKSIWENSTKENKKIADIDNERDFDNTENGNMNNNFENLENKIDTLVNSVNILAQNDNALRESIEKIRDNQHKIEIKVEKLNTSIDWMRWVVPILVGVIMTAGIALINNSISSLKDNNSMQIQRDVAQEFLRQKK